MTNNQHGQVPEALRPEMFNDLIQTFEAAGNGRYDFMRVELPRHQWAQIANTLRSQIAALRTAHVQNPAEIEHVAGDVSKNGAKANVTLPEFKMGRGYIERSIGGTAYREGWHDAIAALRTQQPAPAGATLHDLRQAFTPLAIDQEWTEQHSVSYPRKAAQIINAARALLSHTASEWDVRGHLAASLTCWHRLTEQEADELVAMFNGQPAPAGATPECLTCNDHGAVGNILTAEPCPDCTRWNAQPAPQPAPATQQARVVPESIEQLAVARYKVVPAHESMFHRWAVVAGDGAQQLYLGREVECENMARKFAGAFLDGAFVALQNAAPQPSTTAQAAESGPAPEYVGNGMFKSETIEKAAEHWANWCDRRCMTGLSEFLRVVAARAPAESVGRDALTQAARDVLAERQRQISAEGWTPEHDDEHTDGSLSVAAACYALTNVACARPGALSTTYLATWVGWGAGWFKPSYNRRRDLEKACALILAEIERIDRAALAANGDKR